ncbi:MAG: type II secretion system F family protein, partial [Gammaproteobacteria bacterium]|nr:type II secretion system F family protein [Gammaproteobacteria bacterium]
PGIRVEEITSKTGREVKVRLRIEPDCTLGEHFLRVRTSTGVSALRMFFVGPFDPLDEREPNDKAAAAQKIALSAIVLGVALLAPNWWVEHRVRRRQSRLRNGFPDALDMLVICVESGLGLTAAMERVANEIRQLHPELSLELAAVNAEIRSGVDRAAALQSLNARTGLPEIRGFVGLLAQTLQLGTGVADSLRIYSTEFRDQRMHRAEERAAKTGTKMIFPLVFCEFPAFFLVAVGPAAVRLFDAFAV